MSLINKIKNRFINYYRFVFYGDRFLLEIKRWFKEQKTGNIRLDYDLNGSSVVFDVGGYEGSWSDQIYDKFKSNIFIFEPVPHFSNQIKLRFADNPKVKVFTYGLSNRNDQLLISLEADASSFHLISEKESVDAEVREFCLDLLSKLEVNQVDLIKINIEGGEYQLLEHMIDNGSIKFVKNLQIQFHNFVPNAIARRNSIREKLKLTHSEVWCYDFVWESWEMNK